MAPPCIGAALSTAAQSRQPPRALLRGPVVNAAGRLSPDTPAATDRRTACLRYGRASRPGPSLPGAGSVGRPDDQAPPVQVNIGGDTGRGASVDRRNGQRGARRRRPGGRDKATGRVRRKRDDAGAARPGAEDVRPDYRRWNSANRSLEGSPVPKWSPATRRLDQQISTVSVRIRGR